MSHRPALGPAARAPVREPRHRHSTSMSDGRRSVRVLLRRGCEGAAMSAVRGRAPIGESHGDGTRKNPSCCVDIYVMHHMLW
jgi:hypothetical protein